MVSRRSHEGIYSDAHKVPVVCDSLVSPEKRLYVMPMHFFDQGGQGQYHRSHQDVIHGGEGLGRNATRRRVQQDFANF